MSTTEGTTGGQGSGGSGSSAPSTTAPVGGKADGAKSSDTRPINAVPGKTAERVAAPGGSGGPGAGGPAAGKGAPGQAGAKTAQAVAVKPGAGQPAGAKKGVPAKKAAAPRPAPTGRRVRLTVSRVDPWSVMKMSFLLSVAIGIAMVVMVFVLWSVLAGMGIFERINEIAADVLGADGSDPFDLMDYIGLARVMSLSIVIGVIDVILITAIATLGAFLYNVSSALVGGLQLTLTDD